MTMDLLADKEDTWSDQDVILLVSAENTIDRPRKQWGNFKKNSNYKENNANNQKATAEISGPHNNDLENVTRVWHIEGKRSRRNSK